VPASSVITGLDTYAFTITASGLVLAAGAACLLVRGFRWSNHRRWTQWSAAYDGLLFVLVANTVAAFHRRLSTMERVTAELSSAADDVFVDLWPSCHLHVVCKFSTIALTAAALLKLLRILWTGRSWLQQRTIVDY